VGEEVQIIERLDGIGRYYAIRFTSDPKIVEGYDKLNEIDRYKHSAQMQGVDKYFRSYIVSKADFSDFEVLERTDTRYTNPYFPNSRS